MKISLHGLPCCIISILGECRRWLRHILPVCVYVYSIHNECRCQYRTIIAVILTWKYRHYAKHYYVHSERQQYSNVHIKNGDFPCNNKCLYKWEFGGINIWTLDSINVWMFSMRLDWGDTQVQSNEPLWLPYFWRNKDIRLEPNQVHHGFVCMRCLGSRSRLLLLCTVQKHGVPPSRYFT